VEATATAIHARVVEVARDLVGAVNAVEEALGVPIINRRLAVTPIALVGEPSGAQDLSPLAEALDRAADAVGVDYVGGFSALVQKGWTDGDLALIRSIPKALAITRKVCASVNVASTAAGINMDAVALMGRTICEAARLTADTGGFGAAKLVTFANVPDDNPFMAGAFLGIGEPDRVINVGVSGPGVVRAALAKLGPDADLGEIAETVKRTAFKVTRVGELAGREVCRRLDARFGIVDLSLAPTPAVGDSIAEIIELMGLERCGAPGTTAALALLTDAVKKGGAMASSYVGGLSGAFIPVSEDRGMAAAAADGALSLEKLEAMSSVCSVGLDMVCIPGSTPPETVAAIIADECAIGVVNRKTTAVRVIPVPGKGPGDRVDYGGLWGSAPVLPVNAFASPAFVRRGGRIPAPVRALSN
ncbi:MAG: PFL family protein, partial [Planctomycetes bacterium]|nr:PFL family protein [Planctomycetota bacterium]